MKVFYYHNTLIMTTTTETTQMSINNRWLMDAEIDKQATETTQMSINDIWLMDTQIKRLSTFVNITKSKKSNLCPKAKCFIPIRHSICSKSKIKG